MRFACSGLILAGGSGARMGENKAFLKIRGKRIFDRLYSVFQGLFDEVLVVTNEPLRYLEWDANIVTDLYPVQSSLVGIHAGLFHASLPHSFVAACDMPFLKKESVEVILGESEPRWDVVLSVTKDGRQPLCAVYSKRCIKPIEAQIERGDFRISNLTKSVRVKEVYEASFRSTDPELISFFNINTRKDLAAAEKINRSRSRLES
ncbi:MAG: molybdenum cofactor guanylyltransferase [Desulfobacterales bacterium]|nr:molybdenum cofactor guanylyltransferase [Desulfobacterales bacterium]